MGETYAFSCAVHAYAKGEHGLGIRLAGARVSGIPLVIVEASFAHMICGLSLRAGARPWHVVVWLWSNR
ncbi:hypothetical protein EMIT0347P_50488 [Pseudomonas sp. IT-347P]